MWTAMATYSLLLKLGVSDKDNGSWDRNAITKAGNILTAGWQFTLLREERGIGSHPDSDRNHTAGGWGGR